MKLCVTKKHIKQTLNEEILTSREFVVYYIMWNRSAVLQMNERVSLGNPVHSFKKDRKETRQKTIKNSTARSFTWRCEEQSTTSPQPSRSLLKRVTLMLMRAWWLRPPHASTSTPTRTRKAEPLRDLHWK